MPRMGERDGIKLNASCGMPKLDAIITKPVRAVYASRTVYLDGQMEEKMRIIEFLAGLTLFWAASFLLMLSIWWTHKY